MPSLQANKATWEQDHDWSRGGDEWSTAWGTTDTEWYVSLLPRVRLFIPTGTILEIGPGFGRWTAYLQKSCERLIVVDLAEKCIEQCRRRFAGQTHIEYHVNDGRSLDMVPDGSIDLVFSFDSLVHADETVLSDYVEQIARKLTPGGVAFLHHSNLGQYSFYYRTISLLPRGRATLARLSLGLIDDVHSTWRDPTMSAEKFRRFADRAGLRCLHQELVNWNTRRLIDCFSVAVRRESRWKGMGGVVRNPHFMREARQAAVLSRVYADNILHDGGSAGD